MAFYYPLKAQLPDSSAFERKKISRTDIEFTFSYYNQDGNNSAVTGGTGTEKLSVYATGLTIRHQFKEFNKLSFSAGIDVISSASTDKIDHIRSSASVKDNHFHLDAGFQRRLKNVNLVMGGGAGVALESDYLSAPVSFSMQYTEPSEMRSYQMGVFLSFDDLRWGRLNPDYMRPESLVYPEELRYKEWYDVYRRDSYNIKFGFTQVLSRKIILGIFPEFVYQKGLLATPFHRVYFSDSSLRVENLPKQRFKFPLSIKLNAFLGKRFILKSQYSFYADNFGIIANAIELQGAIKIVPQFTLSPFVRIYHQSGSKFFKPYKEHLTSEVYYTSDYDLSAMNTYKAGMELKFFPMGKRQHRLSFDNILFRYSYYYRSNHLQAHTVNLTFMFASEYVRKKRE